MGGLPWDVAARDLPVPEAISQRRAALGIPQATPRAQEAPPQAAKRGQGQACGDGQTAPDTQDQSTKRSKSVYNIISTQGWQSLTHEPRSRFPQRSPFRPLFGAFYPDPAHKSALRAEAATDCLAPGKPDWPPTSTWPLFSGHAPCLKLQPNQRGELVAQALPRRLLPDSNRRFVKERTGPITTSGPSHSVCRRIGLPLRTNLFFSPLTALRPLAILTW